MSIGLAAHKDFVIVIDITSSHSLPSGSQRFVVKADLTEIM